MERIIPIFPLPLVIYPAAMYPIHVFEERYLLLINNALKYHTSIGVVPLDEDQITGIGTISNVLEKVNIYANGEVDVIVEGTKRFRIGKWWMHSAGYAEASVTPYDDEEANGSPILLHELESKFRETIKDISVPLDEAFWRNLARANSKAYKIAEKSGLALPQQIKLLSLQNENERVQFLITHLERLQESLKRREIAQKFTMHDGYINR
ncbi:MAG: LON peptidase substrate-binding domain-containing protein [Ignavibacteria bacterium]|nr:LON peptidase substrate-binding domain-containing protein [Ignavibacteria bacterium]